MLTLMLSRRFHFLPLLGVLVLGLLTSPVSTIGFVWCFSADGHAEMEAALAGECTAESPVAPADEVSAHMLDAGADACGSCLDITCTPQWGSSRGRHSETPVHLPPPVTPATVVSAVPQSHQFLTNGFLSEPSPRIAEPILHHRTTVLLI